MGAMNWLKVICGFILGLIGVSIVTLLRKGLDWIGLIDITGSGLSGYWYGGYVVILSILYLGVFFAGFTFGYSKINDHEIEIKLKISSIFNRYPILKVVLIVSLIIFYGYVFYKTWIYMSSLYQFKLAIFITLFIVGFNTLFIYFFPIIVTKGLIPTVSAICKWGEDAQANGITTVTTIEYMTPSGRQKETRTSNSGDFTALFAAALAIGVIATFCVVCNYDYKYYIKPVFFPDTSTANVVGVASTATKSDVSRPVANKKSTKKPAKKSTKKKKEISSDAS